MKRGNFRNQKSHSVLLSLYSLSGTALVFYSLLLLTLFIKITPLLGEWDGSAGPLIRGTLQSVGLGGLLAFPLALAATLYSVLFRESFSTRVGRRFLRIMWETPGILWGGGFLLVFGVNSWSLVSLLVFVAFLHLTFRWEQVARQVPREQLEMARSLGMDFYDLVGLLYVRPFAWHFLGHWLSVTLNLCLLISPFLCFSILSDGPIELASLALLKEMLGVRSTVAWLVAFLFCVHGLKFFVDRRLHFYEVEYG